jgi:hypothetical protein
VAPVHREAGCIARPVGPVQPVGGWAA